MKSPVADDVRMGLAYAELILENPRDAGLRPVRVGALAHTGSVYLCLPAGAAARLGLRRMIARLFTRRMEMRIRVPTWGPVRVRCDNRSCHLGAIVLGDEVLLGAIPMEDMDLIVVSQERRVIANPRHPNFAAGAAKGLRAGAS